MCCVAPRRFPAFISAVKRLTDAGERLLSGSVCQTEGEESAAESSPRKLSTLSRNSFRLMGLVM